jgi:hypothetical protein
MPDGIKYIDLDEFMEEGFLQEANRKFFHPLGLALQVTSEFTRADFEKAMVAKGYQYGEDAMSNAWAGFQAVMGDGGSRTFLSAVWDYREDPEGMLFSLDDLRERGGDVKAFKVEEERKKHLEVRHVDYGCDPETGVQPCPDWDD